jgi:flagellin
LDQASTNAEDGVSAVQTAEGALTEVHSMLQRMNELATQAANGTNSESDRQSIQDEIDQLTTEIDRVSETTKFNETYLLKGSKGTKTQYLTGYDAGITGTFVDSATTATLTVDLAKGSSITIGGMTYNIVQDDNLDETNRTAESATGDDSIAKLQSDITKLNSSTSVVINGTTYSGTADANGVLTFDDGAGNSFTAGEIAKKVSAGSSVKIGAKDAYIARDYTDKTSISQDTAKTMVQKALTQANNIGVSSASGVGTAATVAAATQTTGSTTKFDFKITKGHNEVVNDLNFNLHVGADADMTNKIGVTISTMSATGLGISGLNVSDDSGNAATYAIDAIAEAISTVSAQRSALGAVQNRLEHTINNLDNVVENTTSAESRIRDTDMAEEMVEYSKNNILAQAGQSMLAQANSSNQGVLSLLG